VDALLSAKRPADEIIVIARHAPEYDELADKGIRVIYVPHLYPPGKMRNIGARAARGTLLAFIDDDCIPPSDWLKTVAAAVQEERHIGAVGCRVVGADQGGWARCADFALFTAYQYMVKKTISLGSAALIVQRAAFEEVQGFDEQLKASEDWDFSLRLTERGWKCVFTPESEVRHHHRCTTLGSIFGKAYGYGVCSSLTVQRRHLSQMSWLARLSVTLGSPWSYWLLILPYAALVTLFQACDFFRHFPGITVYVPVIFASRCVYHVGVWRSLAKSSSPLHESTTVG
jgi:cellulose synthase/poly-beta-1,6-N-acetylglucosamine synthase-like glycosyltransferase